LGSRPGFRNGFFRNGFSAMHPRYKLPNQPQSIPEARSEAKRSVDRGGHPRASWGVSWKTGNFTKCPFLIPPI
jgi:hypothetical protein